jgi:hypothetical protein
MSTHWSIWVPKVDEWKQMAIFVMEDDAQDGLDSVDAHRSLLMVISPYARRGYAVRGHTSIASIFKTIYLPLGAPPLNQYDAAAEDFQRSRGLEMPNNFISGVLINTQKEGSNQFQSRRLA